MFQLDIFQLPVSLYLHKSDQTSTCFGKLMTLVLIGFFLFMFFTSDAFHKTNSTATVQEFQRSQSPEIQLIPSKFRLVAGLTNDINVFSLVDSYFDIKLLVCHILLSDSKFSCAETAMEPCTKEHFLLDPNEFSEYKLEGAYCFPNNNNTFVKGYWNQDEIQYVSIQLLVCSNASHNHSCKSEEEINNFLNSFSYFQVYLTNYHINVADYESPITSKLETYYQMVDLTQYKSMNLFLQKATLETREGVFLDESSYRETYLHNNMFLDSKTINLENRVVNELVLYSSVNEKNIIRKYQTFAELFAKMGGIFNIFMILGFFMAKIENYFRVIGILSNELFIFQSLDTTQTKNRSKEFEAVSSLPFQNREKYEMSSFSRGCDESKLKPSFRDPMFIEKANNNNIDVNIPKESISIEKKFEINPHFSLAFDHVSSAVSTQKAKNKNNLKDETAINNEEIKEFPPRKSGNPRFSSMKKVLNWFRRDKNDEKNANPKSFDDYLEKKNKQNYFSLGLWGYFKLLIKQRRFRLNNKEKLFLKAESQIIKELDISTILKMMQDINRLKILLLNDEQLFLFNYLSRPMMGLESEDKRRDRRYKYSMIHEKSSFEKEKLIKCYYDIKMKADSSVGTDTDRKIIHLLDDDVVSILQNI